YITSTDILIGGEVDKILSILAVTVVLAVALARARRILVRSVAEQAAARDLSRFFAPDVVTRITASETLVRAGQGETRQAAILYLDIRGFTALARRLPADQVMALLGEYQSRMVPVIQHHGGSIDKFLGDGILATFGAAMTTESYAADAIAAAEALLDELVSWNLRRESLDAVPLRMAVGVAVGPVVFGAVGDDTRLEYTVIGDAVNLAAKLEKHCKVEAVQGLTTASAMARARDQGYAMAADHDILPARRIEGIDETLDLAVIAA
ncbi:MAG: adenylate/guanylate cyclase domain-containing protein, partial [Proteobacteria bacterium]|nr:adenylate/guanylate cyclase domain-containing protein [Pseudomonadota bacterium]